MSLILITGGCGFIGCNLVRSILAQDDNKVMIIDNLSSGSKEQLAGIIPFQEVGFSELGDQSVTAQVVLVKGDVQDVSLAMMACREANAIVHLAANPGVIPSIEDPRYDCLTNVVGTLNYLEAARENGVKRFVFASSGAPLGEQIPPNHEEMVPCPKSPYGASKLSGEGYCMAYHGSFGLDTVVLRFGNVYGPYSNRKNSVVAKFIKHILASEPLTIYGDGNQTRDFIHVSDLIQAIHLAMVRPRIGGEIFHIGTEEEHTIVEVAEELNRLAKKYLGRTCPVLYEKKRKGEVRRSYSDISKARKLLGFKPKFDLRRGLEDTFLWFLENNVEEGREPGSGE
jgi:UDP-glucose 4-epimerase